MKLRQFFLVSLPIGNLEDITLRAIRILNKSDAIIVENIRNAKKTLNLLNIDCENKTLFLLNTHNQYKSEDELIQNLSFNFEHACIISDAGTPVFADPGQNLVSKLIEYGVNFTFIPGANSMLAGLVLSGFSLNKFYYLGFISQKKKERIIQLKKIKKFKTLLVILEAPYRLQSLLADLTKIFPTGIKISISFSLTTPQEKIFRGRLDQALKKYQTNKNKSPFVIIIDNN